MKEVIHHLREGVNEAVKLEGAACSGALSLFAIAKE